MSRVTVTTRVTRHVTETQSVIVTSNTEMAAMVITGDHLVRCHEHTVRAPLSLTYQWDRDQIREMEIHFL